MTQVKDKKIIIRGARQNNLKNISLELPKNKLIVFTGVSGSGKSSLVFDTIYAEGQRRYVESLSAYARQFLERMPRPDVDSISGIAPAVAIEQKPPARNPRSTVGTTTEIYDYLRLLYARIGKTYCEVCGEIVQKDSTHTVIEKLKTFPAERRLLITFPLPIHEKRTLKEEFKYILSKGFFRIYHEGEIYDLNESLNYKFRKESVRVIVERVSLDLENVDIIYSDSIETAFNEGEGRLILVEYDNKVEYSFSKRFECHDKVYIEPEPRLFSFNNPFGACPACQGFGKTIGIDYDLVIPDKNKSLESGAIEPFTKRHASEFQREMIRAAVRCGVRTSVPFKDLTPEELKFVFEGNRDFIGLKKFFEKMESKKYKIFYRVFLSKYRAYTTCPDCGGSRLRKDALNVRVANKKISELINIPLDSLLHFFLNINLDEYEWKIAERIIEEIIKRLKFLVDVGIGYLTLDRLSNTLSGGETQRINLASILGSSMVGAIYILDEPSIGLHARDNSRLINVLHQLKNLGNTVLVVEHDPEMIKEADFIVDMGKGAGIHGGEIVFAGKYDDLLKNKDSLTGKYLSGHLSVSMPAKRRPVTSSKIKINGASENNLKGIDVEIPLNVFVCITGVSGSGKSTLVNEILYPAIRRLKHNENVGVGKYKSIDGLGFITDAEIVDQSPIGKTSRSNPATYTKAFDFIREFYAQRPQAQARGYTPGYFSFNVPGGRCETCLGEGFIKIEMQFLADIYLVCEDCKGKRFKKEVQEIFYHGKNIVDVLDMTVEEALEFFKDQKKIVQRLQPLMDVGLGYIKLGQPATTLSGGEAQRVKLAERLIPRENHEHILYIFDEPTTGLHFYDINKLLKCFDSLIENGNSILVIEHNLDVIKYADYIIDLGPEAGEYGGEIVATGTPEEIMNCEKSYTGHYLKKYLRLD